MKHRLLGSLIVVVALLTGCAPGIPGGGLFDGAKPQIQDGPAPASVNNTLAIRADEVTRQGSTVTVGFTFGNAGHDETVYASSTKILTDTGLEIDVDFTNREIPRNSMLTLGLSVPLPESNVKSLIVEFDGTAPVTVPLPTRDGSYVWRPAPLRQVGLTPTISRSKENEVTIGAIRSEGMITEIEYQSAGLNGHTPDLCTVQSSILTSCVLVEADGTKHPVLTSGTTSTNLENGRMRGTVRFLGELKPDSTDLTVHLHDHRTQLPDPIRITLPTHENSSAMPAAGHLSRPTAPITGVAMKNRETGATVTVRSVDVLSDHVQVTISATGGAKDFKLEASAFGSHPSALIEPNGTQHRLQPAGTVDLVIKAHGKLDAVLAFQGVLPPDVTSLTLSLGGDFANIPIATSVKPMTATLTIPAAPDTAPPASTKLSDVIDQSQHAHPVVTASPAPAVSSGSPNSTTATITHVATHPLPVGTFSSLGRVVSSVIGVAPATSTASAPDSDARAEAEAQRRLQDLGAQRTPDGWVVTLPEIVLFDYNKAEIKTDAATKLDTIAKVITYYDQAQISIQGHTDNTGTVEHNVDLSKRRAQAVADALTRQGIASSRMAVEGFGFAKPIASNATDEGKAKNRRVEVVLRSAA